MGDMFARYADWLASRNEAIVSGIRGMNHEEEQIFWSAGLFGLTFLIMGLVAVHRTKQWDVLAVILTVLAFDVGILFVLAALSVPYHSLDVLTPYRAAIRYIGAIINILVIVAVLIDDKRRDGEEEGDESDGT